jgi:hypothetical protein
MNEIDQALDSMSPAELSIIEQELDKQAAETRVAFHFQSGVKMAAEAYDLYKTTGELSPLLSLVTEQPKVTAEVDGVDAELDKCSAEQLAAIEAELDKAAEQKIADEYAARYFDMGVKMAQAQVAALSGGDATRVASCSRAILDKIAAAGQFLGGLGFNKAKETVLAARRATGSTAGARKTLTTGLAGGAAAGARWSQNHPVMRGAAIGVGGTLAAQSMFGDKNK